MDRLEQEAAERCSVQQQAREAELLYHALLCQSPMGVVVIDLHTMLPLQFNETAHRQLGYTAEEFARLSMADYDTVDGDSESIRRYVERILQQGRNRFQTHHRTKSGEVRTVEVHAQKVEFHGKPALLCVFHDITEYKRACEARQNYQVQLAELVAQRTRELQQANFELQREIQERKNSEQNLRNALRRLEEHERAHRDFVSNVSHELKTPLTSAHYCLENLLSGVVGPLPDRVREYLLIMQEDCERLAGTVRDILDLSLLDVKRLVLHRAKLPLARFAHKKAVSLRFQAEEKGLRLLVQADCPPGFVDADPQRLERVILNILENAIKYTPPGGTVEMAIDTSQADQLLLRVTDTGIGIPADCIERVTERYFRVGEQASGSGIGLAICKEVLKLHNGQLIIKSPPPGRTKGTEVTVALPRAPAPTILVADDEPQECAALNKLLEDTGYRVVACDNGQQAWELLLSSKPDAVLLNDVLPGITGLEIIVQMKADRRLQDLPTVVITGKVIDQEHRELLESLKICVVMKPWNDEFLLDCLETAMIGSRRGWS